MSSFNDAELQKKKISVVRSITPLGNLISRFKEENKETLSTQNRLSTARVSKLQSSYSQRTLTLPTFTLESYLQRKLSFEWKNIYRRLTQQSLQPNVPVALFNQACVYFGVILSAEEV